MCIPRTTQPIRLLDLEQTFPDHIGDIDKWIQNTEKGDVNATDEMDGMLGSAGRSKPCPSRDEGERKDVTPNKQNKSQMLDMTDLENRQTKEYPDGIDDTVNSSKRK
jgi:hypothetical protein